MIARISSIKEPELTVCLLVITPPDYTNSARIETKTNCNSKWKRDWFLCCCCATSHFSSQTVATLPSQEGCSKKHMKFWHKGSISKMQETAVLGFPLKKNSNPQLQKLNKQTPVVLSIRTGEVLPAQVHPRSSTLEEPAVPSTVMLAVVVTTSACQITQNTTAMVNLLHTQHMSTLQSMKHGALKYKPLQLTKMFPVLCATHH